MEFSLQHTIELLSAAPGSIRSLISGLSPEWTSSLSRDDWGPADIVGHLIHAEYTDWIPRARVILEQAGDRRFPPFDRFGHFELAKGKDLAQLLDEFDAARAASLATLEGWKLSSHQFLLTGEHPEFGSVSLGQLLATWTVHDLTHIRQIVTSMASRYSEAVGPWREYLSILKS